MQINRLFETIYLLLNKQTLTAKELANHFEVSTRTIYRDVELLSSAGIPIYMTKGKRGGISLLPDYILNKTVLTHTEKENILSALHALDAVSLENTNTAIQKLSSLFGTSHRDWVEVDFSSWSNTTEESATFASLKSAILHKQTVTFLYHTQTPAPPRIVEPLKLCFKGQSWYLYAYCTLRNDYRFFKLRRIKALQVQCESFERLAPPRVFQETQAIELPLITLKLKISKTLAFRVFDEFPTYTTLDDGSFLTELKMPDNHWLDYYIASFGEYCEVLEPETIRQRMREKLKKTLSLYS